MQKKSIITIIIFIFLFSIFSFWVYSTLKNRYFQNEDKDLMIIENENFNEKKNSENVLVPEESQEDETEKNNEITEDIKSLPMIPEQETELFHEISRSDCLNECKNFENGDLKEYCLQSCGISPLTENLSKDETEKVLCTESDGLQRDYCLKDMAVEKKDFTLCEKIVDKNIRKLCITRITEEIIGTSPTTTPEKE